MKKIILCLSLLLFITGCSSTGNPGTIIKKDNASIVQTKVAEIAAHNIAIKEQERIEKEKQEQLAKQQEEAKKQEEQKKQANTKNRTAVATNNNIIAIDPGHQAHGNSALEPIGPGATTQKAKVTTGATGVSSKVPESVTTLSVSMKLKSVLEARGYQIVMTRTSQNVNLSNKERADIANQAGAGAFIRLHCNSFDNSSATGALTMAPTASNPYCPTIVSSSTKLSKNVLNSLCATTGAKNRGVSYTDTMSGINWCQVPVTIVEMGFVSNPNEDILLNSDAYQNKMAEGIANGIDTYFGR